MGVGATVEEFKEAVEREAKVVAMVNALVESEEEPLTNDPDAIGELCEALSCMETGSAIFLAFPALFCRVLKQPPDRQTQSREEMKG